MKVDESVKSLNQNLLNMRDFFIRQVDLCLSKGFGVEHLGNIIEKFVNILTNIISKSTEEHEYCHKESIIDALKCIQTLVLRSGKQVSFKCYCVVFYLIFNVEISKEACKTILVIHRSNIGIKHEDTSLHGVQNLCLKLAGMSDDKIESMGRSSSMIYDEEKIKKIFGMRFTSATTSKRSDCSTDFINTFKDYLNREEEAKLIWKLVALSILSDKSCIMDAIEALGISAVYPPLKEEIKRVANMSDSLYSFLLNLFMNLIRLDHSFDSIGDFLQLNDEKDGRFYKLILEKWNKTLSEDILVFSVLKELADSGNILRIGKYFFMKGIKCIDKASSDVRFLFLYSLKAFVDARREMGGFFIDDDGMMMLLENIILFGNKEEYNLKLSVDIFYDLYCSSDEERKSSFLDDKYLEVIVDLIERYHSSNKLITEKCVGIISKSLQRRQCDYENFLDRNIRVLFNILKGKYTKETGNHLIEIWRNLCIDTFERDMLRFFDFLFEENIFTSQNFALKVCLLKRLIFL